MSTSFLCLGFSPTAAIMTWLLAKSGLVKTHTYWPTHTVRFNTELFKDDTFQPEQYDLATAPRGTTFDVVLLVISSIKDVARICKKVQPVISKNTLILVEVSGGAGTLQRLARQNFPKNQVSGVICDLNTALLMDRQSAVWHVRQYGTAHSAGPSPAVYIEPSAPKAQSILAVETALTKMGLPAQHQKSAATFGAIQWERSIAIIAFELIGVMVEVPTIEELLKNVVARPIIEGVISEMLAIAGAAGVKSLPSRAQFMKQAPSIVRRAPASFTIKGATRTFYEFHEHITPALDFLVLLPILLSDELSKGVPTPYLESIYAFMSHLVDMNSGDGQNNSVLFIRRDMAVAKGMGNSDQNQAQVRPSEAEVALIAEKQAKLETLEKKLAEQERSLSSREQNFTASRELHLSSSDELAKRETAVKAREDALGPKEISLLRKEQAMVQREQHLRQREASLDQGPPQGQGPPPHMRSPRSSSVPFAGYANPVQNGGTNGPNGTPQSPGSIPAMNGNGNGHPRQVKSQSSLNGFGSGPMDPPSNQFPLKRRGQSLVTMGDAVGRNGSVPMSPGLGGPGGLPNGNGIPNGRSSRQGRRSMAAPPGGSIGVLDVAEDFDMMSVTGRQSRRQSLRASASPSMNSLSQFGQGGGFSQNFQLDGIMSIAASDRYGIASRAPAAGSRTSHIISGDNTLSSPRQFAHGFSNNGMRSPEAPRPGQGPGYGSGPSPGPGPGLKQHIPRMSIPTIDVPEFSGFTFSAENNGPYDISDGSKRGSSASPRGSGTLSNNSRSTPPQSPSVTPPTPHTLDPNALNPKGHLAPDRVSELAL